MFQVLVSACLFLLDYYGFVINNPACVFLSILLFLILYLGKIKELYNSSNVEGCSLSLDILCVVVFKVRKMVGKTYAAFPAEWAVYFQAFQKLPFVNIVYVCQLQMVYLLTPASSLNSNHRKGPSLRHIGYYINLLNIIIKTCFHFRDQHVNFWSA